MAKMKEKEYMGGRGEVVVLWGEMVNFRGEMAIRFTKTKLTT